jgi:protein involved in polysaccharide export with SLBB domain
MISKISLSAVLLALCGVSAFAQDTPVQSAGYLIGAGDKIVVKVMGEPQFDFDARIDEDGVIQVPFVDKSVSAQCRTEKDLRTDITKLLTKYLKNPQVSLQVTERRSIAPATVYGEVRQQQQVDLRRKARLIELLSFAGGTTEDAGGMVQVFRTQKPMCGNPTEETAWANSGYDVPNRQYSLASVMTGKDESNPVIYPGDVIVVQKASPVYITGEVRQPIGLRIKENGLSLTQAIAMVGGTTTKTKTINIYRLKDNSQERELIPVDYEAIKKGKQKDVMLLPFDIVEVNKPARKPWEGAADIFLGVGKSALGGFGNVLPQRVLY